MDNDELTPLRKAAYAITEMRTRLDAIEKTQTEPIAIIGMSCRYPGAGNCDAYWELLRDGKEALTEVPGDRWGDEYYDPDPNKPGKINTRYGGFLSDIDRFDPKFFGISPLEAKQLDPQHRLLLEVSWEALENAGQAPMALVGSRTGVFIGINAGDYGQRQLSGDPSAISAFTATGNGFCFASGRLSYFYGLRGPSIAVDTACSSSLTALHLACQALRAGECRMAITGGVHLNLAPGLTLSLARAGALSPDGRCKTFAASANGHGMSEGCGVIVLKRYSDAVAQRDNILALIRSTAINHDGPGSGITVPSEIAQEILIRQALEKAKLEPADVDYIETHGTGTSLGDPIEMAALKAVFAGHRSGGNPLVLGSVKTNLAHMVAAAGIGGLMKIVLALQHEQIPPHLHFEEPNPHIDWENFPIHIPTRAFPWPRAKKTRIAGLSSFGISGSNAHVIIEEAPGVKEADEPAGAGSDTGPGIPPGRAYILTFSAKKEEVLMEMAAKYKEYLRQTGNTIADICYTSNISRSFFKHRLALVGTSKEDFIEKLSQCLENPGQAALCTSKNREKSNDPDRDADENALSVTSLGKGSHSVQVLKELAELYLRGKPVDWEAFHRSHNLRKVVIPTYPFRGKSYWIETPASKSDTKVAMDWLYEVQWEPAVEPTKSFSGAVGDRGLLRPSGPSFGAPRGAGTLCRPYGPSFGALIGAPGLPEPTKSFSEVQGAVFQKSPLVAEGTEPAGWLIFSDRGGVGQELAGLLTARGERCSLVYAGSGKGKKENGTRELDPADTAGYKWLLGEYADSGEERPLGILHLWNLDLNKAGGLTLPELERTQVVGSGSVLLLVQALEEYKARNPLPRLWILTRGAMPVGTPMSSLNPPQASVWGLAKVIMQEYPEMKTRLLDLDFKGTEQEAGMVLEEILAPGKEEKIAYRDGRRYVPRLVPVDTSKAHPGEETGPVRRETRIKPEGTYLITGGLGGLGLILARWILDLGGRHLVLVGRTGVGDGAGRKILEQLEERGAVVNIVKADVTKKEDMVRVFREIGATGYKLRGIIHAAGMNTRKSIKEMDIDAFGSVLAPKVLGGWVLHELTQQMDLDFFIVYSSIASVWGSLEQAHYSAANTFLDVLIHYRRGLGLPGLSIDWGLWRDGTMASAETRELLSQIGVNQMPTPKALEILQYVMEANYIQVTAADIDWSLFKAVNEVRGEQPFFERIKSKVAGPGGGELPGKQEFRRLLAGVSPGKYREASISYLQSEILNVLAFEETQLPDPEMGFFEMGMNSLLAVEFKRRLETGLGISFPTTLIFDYPNIKELSSYILKEILGKETEERFDGSAGKVGVGRADILSEIEQVSPGDIEESIDRELKLLQEYLARK